MNWTLSDSILRVTIPVGVSYESDVEVVEKALLEIAAAHPMVLKDPEPKGYFLGFGDSTLNFELRVHCSGIDDFVPIKHFMHMEIMKSFREKGIEIAFPQRDLHIRSSDVEFVAKNKMPQIEATKDD